MGIRYFFLCREFRLEETAEFQAEVRTPGQKDRNTFWSILYNELNATQAVTGPGACVMKVQTPMDDVTGTLCAVLKMFASLFRIERAKASKKKCSRSYLQQRQRISRHDTNLWNLIKHILTSSLNCYWTDALQHAIYLFSNHNYNKILKSNWFSNALISALIGQFNRTVRVMPK